MPEGQEQPQHQLAPKEALANLMAKQRNHAAAIGAGIINATLVSPDLVEAGVEFATGNKPAAIAKALRSVLIAYANTGAIATLENKWHKAQNKQNS